jgi:hypothetical protein
MTMPIRLRTASAAAAMALLCQAAFAQPAGVDPQADKIFRAMTTYVSGLKQFSAQTESTIEIVTAAGQKIQFTAPSSVTVSRPDKLYAERQGDIVNQKFYYDGKSLTLYNPDTKHYATVPAPGNLDAMLEFASAKLDVIAPGADLIDTRAYQLLMRDVTAGTYLGLAMVSGQRCHHLAFRATEVDWQVWVRDGDRPAPCKYVITSKMVTGAPQFSMNILKWDAAPKVAADKFRFAPPAGAKSIEFLPVKRAQ